METRNLELKLVKIDGSYIDHTKDYINLSAELDHNTRLDSIDRFHPDHLDITISNYQGNEEEEAHLINKIYNLGYKIHKEKQQNDN